MLYQAQLNITSLKQVLEFSLLQDGIDVSMQTIHTLLLAWPSFIDMYAASYAVLVLCTTTLHSSPTCCLVNDAGCVRMTAVE